MFLRPHVCTRFGARWCGRPSRPTFHQERRGSTSFTGMASLPLDLHGLTSSQSLQLLPMYLSIFASPQQVPPSLLYFLSQTSAKSSSEEKIASMFLQLNKQRLIISGKGMHSSGSTGPILRHLVERYLEARQSRRHEQSSSYVRLYTYDRAKGHFSVTLSTSPSPTVDCSSAVEDVSTAAKANTPPPASLQVSDLAFPSLPPSADSHFHSDLSRALLLSLASSSFPPRPSPSLAASHLLDALEQSLLSHALHLSAVDAEGMRADQRLLDDVDLAMHLSARGEARDEQNGESEQERGGGRGGRGEVNKG